MFPLTYWKRLLFQTDNREAPSATRCQEEDVTQLPKAQLSDDSRAEETDALPMKSTPETTCYWRTCSASVPGLSHERLGLPCQDAARWVKSLAHPVLFLAVADGAGSARLSQLGSSRASRAALDFLETRSGLAWDEASEDDLRALLLDAVAYARDAVAEEATQRDANFKEFATTLLLAVVTPQLVAVAQLGDGGLVVRDTAGKASLLVRPQEGEYVNQTDFLTGSRAVQQVQLAFWRGDVEAVAAFTDGLQRLALVYPAAEPFAPFFDPLFTFMEELKTEEEERAADGHLAQFLVSPAVREKADDDLTLVLARAWRSPDGVFKDQKESVRSQDAPKGGSSGAESDSPI